MNKLTKRLVSGLAMASAICVMHSEANAESRFYIPDTPVIPGEEVRLPICIDNDIPIVAFNFDVVFPEGITPVMTGGKPRWTREPERYPKGTVYDDETGEEKEQNFYTYSFASNLIASNQARFLAYSNENLPMEIGEGPVAYVIATVDAGFKGESTGQVLAISIADYQTNAVPVPEDIDYNVFVGVESVTVTPAEAMLEAGKDLQMSASLLPAGAEGTTISWASSDESVAIVSELGVVTAVAPGKATITAKAQDKEGAAEITVVALQPVTLSILPADDVAILVGETAELSVAVNPDGAEASLSWTSSKPEIASVNEDGMVTGIMPGEAVIEVSALNCITNEQIKATKTIKINPVEVAEVAVSAPDNATDIFVGETMAMTASIAPENATYKDVAWTSSQPELASVNEEGVVTAIAAGEVVITAAAANGVSGSYTLTVKNVEAESITLSQTEASSREGSSFRLEATVLPENTTFKTVTWSSDNEEVATVDADGLVTCAAMGSAVITAECGSASATCVVSVTAPLPSGIAFNIESVSLKANETAEVGILLSPEYAEEIGITYSSANTEVATVVGEGLNATVTAVAVGETVITATSENGLTAEMTVTVVPTEVEGVTLVISDNNLYVGDTVAVTAVVDPEDATYKELAWSSSDEGVATVDSEGIVTGIAAGEVTITATANNGIKGEINITVHNVMVEEILLDQTIVEAVEGTQVQITATVLPDNATDKEITWTSSDEEIATVDSNGLVTLIHAGKVVITATAADGSGVAAECTLDVTTGVDMIIGEDETATVYSLNGILIKGEADREYLGKLPKGGYIIRTPYKTVKIVK